MKKLLLILLCLPFIGFGQDSKLDKLIFISGDTLSGNVVEIGRKEVIYKYEGEKTNNIVKASTLVKIVYSSGRVQTFERGLRKVKRDSIRLELKKSDNLKRKINFNVIFPVIHYLDVGFELISKSGNSSIGFPLRIQTVKDKHNHTHYFSLGIEKKFYIKDHPDRLIKRFIGFAEHIGRAERIGLNHNYEKINNIFDSSTSIISDTQFIGGVSFRLHKHTSLTINNGIGFAVYSFNINHIYFSYRFAVCADFHF